MKRLLFIIPLIAISCTKTIYVPTTEYVKGKDSIVIERKDTTIYVDVPAQLNENITNQKSHLSTDYSFSLAWIDSVGLLHHSIRNFTKLPFKIRYETIYKDKYIEKQKTKTITIEKKVTKNHIPIWCWLLLIGNVVYLSFRIKRFFS